MIMEVVSLVSPMANTFVYKVVSDHIIGDEHSLTNTLFWVAVFGAALFFDPETRQGVKLHARAAFLALVAGVALYHWHVTREERQRDGGGPWQDPVPTSRQERQMDAVSLWRD